MKTANSGHCVGEFPRALGERDMLLIKKEYFKISPRNTAMSKQREGKAVMPDFV